MAIPSVDINYFGVLVSAIASMILGALWYSPVLFGNIWVKLSGINKKELDKSKAKGVGKLYFIAFLGSLVTAYVLAHFVKYLNASSTMDAVQAAFWIWMGFVVTVMLGSVLWEGKSVKVYLINIAYHLVSLVLMSIILVLLF